MSFSSSCIALSWLLPQCGVCKLSQTVGITICLFISEVDCIMAPLSFISSLLCYYSPRDGIYFLNHWLWAWPCENNYFGTNEMWCRDYHRLSKLLPSWQVSVDTLGTLVLCLRGVYLKELLLSFFHPEEKTQTNLKLMIPSSSEDETSPGEINQTADHPPTCDCEKNDCFHRLQKSGCSLPYSMVTAET